jgi:hypothetical protein
MEASVTEILPSPVSVIETTQVLTESGNTSYNGAVSWLAGHRLVLDGSMSMLWADCYNMPHICTK